MPEQSDRENVKRTLDGDMLAFRRIVEKHQSFVFRVAYRFVGTIGDAEDITQETFVRLWKSLHRYKPDGKLTTWLYRIAANLCLDDLKSKSTRNSRRMTDIDDHPDTRGAQLADQSIISEELHAVLDKLTGALSAKQKAVFVLRDMEGLTVEETCEILSMTPGNVKSSLHLARKKLAEMLRQYYAMKKSLNS